MSIYECPQKDLVFVDVGSKLYNERYHNASNTLESQNDPKMIPKWSQYDPSLDEWNIKRSKQLKIKTLTLARTSTCRWCGNRWCLWLLKNAEKKRSFVRYVYCPKYWCTLGVDMFKDASYQLLEPDAFGQTNDEYDRNWSWVVIFC